MDLYEDIEAAGEGNAVQLGSLGSHAGVEGDVEGWRKAKSGELLVSMKTSFFAILKRMRGTTRKGPENMDVEVITC